MVDRYKIVTFLFSFFLLFCTTSSRGGEDESAYRLKYLYAIDGIASGQKLKGVSTLHIDEKAGELYILDSGNGRIVITDLRGMPLYSFRIFKSEGSGFSDITVDKKGRILLAEGKSIAIFDYKGIFKGKMDLSSIPEKEDLAIQSITVSSSGRIYLGSGGMNARIIELDSTGNYLNQIKAKGRFLNVGSLKVDDRGLTFLDAGYYKVVQLNWSGKVTMSFGKLSSLLGGFSMPSALALDERKRRILVVDTNRLMVIVFDMEGNPLFEFGGPQTFRWPRTVTISKEGHIYVADGTDKVQVFEVVEKELTPPPPPAVEEKAAAVEPRPAVPVKEVEEIVAKEGRLLPVYFEIDDDLLDDAARMALDKNAQWLKNNKNVSITIRGYADSRGTNNYNIYLCQRRAASVKSYLNRQGVEGERMTIISMGKQMVDENSEEDMKKARRVDFLVK